MKSPTRANERISCSMSKLRAWSCVWQSEKTTLSRSVPCLGSIPKIHRLGDSSRLKSTWSSRLNKSRLDFLSRGNTSHDLSNKYSTTWYRSAPGCSARGQWTASKTTFRSRWQAECSQGSFICTTAIQTQGSTPTPPSQWNSDEKKHCFLLLKFQRS